MNRPVLLPHFEKRIAEPIGSLSGLIHIALALIVLIDVILRTAGVSVSGTTELTESLIVVAIYFGLIFTQSERAHIGMDFLTNALPPAGRRVTDILSLGVAALISIALLYGTGNTALKSIELGEYTSTAFNLPLWPAKVALWLGLLMMTIQIGLQMVRRVLQRPETVPAQESGSTPL